uniref:Uncharacterized protein n=1 Tax=Arundo donax TaxID=35708 RepID=A0A0A9F8L0_ARUDO
MSRRATNAGSTEQIDQLVLRSEPMARSISRPHHVDRYPGHRKVLERLILLPLLLLLPPRPGGSRSSVRSRRLARRLRHRGPELPQAVAAHVTVGRQHAGAVPAEQLRQQQHDRRHEDRPIAEHVDSGTERPKTQNRRWQWVYCWKLGCGVVEVVAWNSMAGKGRGESRGFM